MRYVFFGTPRFAAIIIRNLLEAGMPPVALVSNPDRPVGRKKILTAPETKKLVANSTSDIKILQPEKLNEAKETLLELRADLFVVAAYAKIIKREILDIPRYGTIGVHPSLLPKYRGPSPIQSVLLHGETETGVTLYHMDELVDHGPVLAYSKEHIADSDTYTTLEEKLAERGARLLLETLPRLLKGEIEPLPQDELQATFTKKFAIEDSSIEADALLKAQDGSDPVTARVLYNKIRALNPEPGTWTNKDGMRVKILEVTLVNERLVLLKIQKEGKTPRILRGV